MTRLPLVLFTLSLLGLSQDALVAPAEAKRPLLSDQSSGLPSQYKLEVVKKDGKSWYRTFRVMSKKAYDSVTDKDQLFRFFQRGNGQYGEAFYLFRSAGTARKFAASEAERGAGNRNLIVEILLPKDRFDAVKKAEVPASADWWKNEGQLKQLRLDNHVLYGRWADSPSVQEPFYKKLVRQKQFAIVQRGLPSVLMDAKFSIFETTGKTEAQRGGAEKPPAPKQH